MTSVDLQTKENTFDIQKSSSLLPGPQWLINRRETFANKMVDIKWPSSSQELWRYTDIDSFDINDYRPLSLDDIGELGKQSAPGAGIIAAQAGEHSGLVVVHDGRVVHCTLDEELKEKGVILTAIEDIEDPSSVFIDQYLGEISKKTADTFTDLTEALALGGAYLFVPRSVVVPKPIVIIHWVDGENIAVFPRTLVVADTNSQVSVIERFESSSQKMFISSITECMINDNAHLKYLTTQEEGKNTTHIGLHKTYLNRDSRFESSTIALGGKYARHRGEVSLLGQGATSDVMAVYYGDEDQQLDFRTLQDHVSPNTTSNLLFKGAVEDTAQSVYSGMIHIREEAQKSQAYQTNRNLVLDHGAHAESIPNLMIEANDVKCSHGSTVGPIDEEQLYYLQTRGVSPSDAEKLVVLGFFEDVFSRLSIPALIDPLRRSVNEKLSSLTQKND